MLYNCTGSLTTVVNPFLVVCFTMDIIAPISKGQMWTGVSRCNFFPVTMSECEVEGGWGREKEIGGVNREEGRKRRGILKGLRGRRDGDIGDNIQSVRMKKNPEF
ncbi:calcium uptake protein 1, mitochondrial [Platysternon megacephalum]|uniref:Calcium uptake protein 1, mitochondrial n=1 Tax=Platysternon megacephalum TaxID=55544 RepID=A0A4D9EP47_9SAUR|nr:calcium uptake protein 1, mitochondrial [Platysternon megacephalum]